MKLKIECYMELNIGFVLVKNVGLYETGNFNTYVYNIPYQVGFSKVTWLIKSKVNHVSFIYRFLSGEFICT